jgi:molybdate transport system substrate-binding protein
MMKHPACFLSAAILACTLPLMTGCGHRSAGVVGGESPATKDRSGSPPAEESKTANATEKAAAPASEVELLILCGSSFRPPMEKLVAMYEKQTGVRLLMSFGGSEDHLPHVQAKAMGDFYVAHTPYMQYTRDAGALLREVDVGFLAPVLVVAKGNPKQIKRIEDLAQPGVSVVLPNPEYSTCGQMVEKLLEKKQIKDAVMKNAGGALMKHHSEIGNQLKLGTREAGIMWNGVAHNFLDAIDIVPTPYEYDEQIQVAVMGLSYTKHPEAVEKFLDFVEKHGKDVFSEFGYVK